jgi:hypothetical protein
MHYTTSLVESPVVKMAIGTVVVILFLAHVLYHDLPPRNIPVVGKYFRK